MSTLGRLFNLHSGEDDKLKVLKNVRSNVYFRGATLWILACAIFVASVGLNVNSTAVIIGAMLISPLMGPIIGAGFGLGIFDFILFKRSIKNLAIATIVSLIVSSIYFYLSPFKEAQSELLARTAPNIFDVMIAFFGGLAGVIAMTRVEKGLPLAGVAIATALMPPLCTAGYGLGTGNYAYFAGAIFLYTINCVFICIATYIVVKYLKYPLAKQVDKKHEVQVKYIITAIIITVMAPSAYFAYDLYQEQKFSQNVKNFLRSEFENKGDVIIYNRNDYRSSPKKIEVAFLTRQLKKQELDSLNNKLPNYGLQSTRLLIKQDTIGFAKMYEQGNNVISKSDQELNEKNILLAQLQKKLDLSTYDNKSIMGEAEILFPTISNLSIGNHDFAVNDSTTQIIPVALYMSEEDISSEEKDKLLSWLQKN
ncbi:DUF389 domain-containing protein [Niabella ginsengisoli]|uniref:DUF389 domain-containing protein n=1 Tax=Niabella ginsengisoli TaxID=522298 RepID=A0ABS9SL99_9BACT|nr:DUF389 domain-containing protein [Niabella ginsengisoli]MCH5599157.1 DUF389 domain-containing protein [Niabella ginsengisoli]